MKLFSKKSKPDQTDIVFEKWNTSFLLFQERRFIPESSEYYNSEFEKGKLKLSINKRNFFAWTDNPFYRYDNFLLKADIGISTDNGYSSVGLLFRRTDDLSYYYFLVSNKGYYRVDLVMNGTPSAIIDWTPCPEFNASKFNIIISADGGLLSFYLDGDWIGNVSDESLVAGGISFAGQNYDESERVVFYLHYIEIDSRPVQIESRREKLLSAKVPDKARLGFAESRMRSGHYSAALIELRKVLEQKAGDTEVLMMAADCCLSLEMYSEAEAFLEQVPAAERDNRYYLQKAGLYYLKNDFLLLRDFLIENLPALEQSAAAYNLLGNAEYSLGNWEKAVVSYGKAVDMDAGQALFLLNKARALQKCGRTEQAAAMYGKAARQYFRNGEYDELEGILPFLEGLDESNPETRSLKARLLFNDNNFSEAEKLFKGLMDDGTTDSSVYYLDALIQARNKKKKKAMSCFEKAIELEPEYYLYPFKFAEYLFINGGDYAPLLEKAAKLAPSDPWVLNLSGLAEMTSGNYEVAGDYFKKALAAAPGEDEIKVNCSEALFLAGRIDDAFEQLDVESPDILNQRGNLHARLNDYQSAINDYEAASSSDRERSDIMLNLAAACIETDSFSRAEELLVKVLDSGDNAQAYNFMGNLAMLKGEYSRAEAAYRKALETNPEFIDAVCNLVELFVNRERLNDADMLLSRVKVQNPGGRFERLKDMVFKKRMNVYSCGYCGLEWIVPKKMGSQPPLKLVGEPPDSMPAGKCSGCGKIYCIGCAKKNLNEGRFICEECGSPLKLSEDWMRYLYHEKTL